MTQSEFLRFIIDNDCFVYQKKEYYYKLRKKGTRGSLNMSGLPIAEPDTELFPELICQVCRSLGIDPPEECAPSKTIIETVWQWILTHILGNKRVE